ncbi:hypothetical protein RRG08_037852 [Elysia crispata]|uniref:Uncharacterized protein n=1 Tax=Elysia crispata TaxID=231223 RepID=A0AAE0ZJP3_9GAST|nr:hypothetical protein RRG08_037852 [Elysia crispata]
MAVCGSSLHLWGGFERQDGLVEADGGSMFVPSITPWLSGTREILLTLISAGSALQRS